MRKKISLGSYVGYKVYTHPTISLRKFFRLSDDLANKFQKLETRAHFEDSLSKYKREIFIKVNNYF